MSAPASAPARKARAAAVIGDPIGHSLSPVIQNAAFHAAGLEIEYEAVRVPLQALSNTFFDLRRRYMGLNVTAPLKEAVIACLERVEPVATAIRSVNTVAFEGGVALGHSTDGAGFLAALRRATDRPIDRAVVLGTGGAARAVAAALAMDGIDVAVWGRNEAAGRHLVAIVEGLRGAPGVGVVGRVQPMGSDADALVEALGRTDLLVNATPLGGLSGPSTSPIPHDVTLSSELVVFDLVYRPRRTALLERAVAAGCMVVEGIEMLIEQGARSFEIWTGVAPPVEEMRRAAYSALDDVDASRGRATREREAG